MKPQYSDILRQHVKPRHAVVSSVFVGTISRGFRENRGLKGILKLIRGD